MPRKALVVVNAHGHIIFNYRSAHKKAFVFSTFNQEGQGRTVVLNVSTDFIIKFFCALISSSAGIR